MIGTLIAAIALLIAMLYLIIRPFVFMPRVAATSTVAAEPIEHESITQPEPVAVTANSAAGPSADGATSDVRARVEAAIAARKAALSAPKCGACAAAVTDEDIFCRSCGNKLR